MVQDQRGIQSRVARRGDGILQLSAGPHGEEGWMVGGVVREKSRAGSVTAKEMAQGLGRLGFAAIGRGLSWGRYMRSSAIQGRQGPMTIPTMLKVLFSWLADRLEGGDRLQRPSRPPSET